MFWQVVYGCYGSSRAVARIMVLNRVGSQAMMWFGGAESFGVFRDVWGSGGGTYIGDVLDL